MADGTMTIGAYDQTMVEMREGQAWRSGLGYELAQRKGKITERHWVVRD